MSPLADKMAPIAARLGRIRGGIRRLYALDGLSRLALVLGAFVVVTFLIDWALILPAYVRLFFLCAGGAVLGWLLFKHVVRPLAVRISDDDLALFVERQYPELNDRLISAIQLVREPLDLPAGENARRESSYNSPELVEALVRDAERATASIDFGRVIVRKYVGKVALAGGLAAFFMLAGAVWNPADCAAIYLSRIVGGARKWPQRTHLRVLDFVDGRRVHARGEDLIIAVVCEGVEPSKVNLEYRFRTGEHGKERMSPVEGQRYQFLFPRLSGPFEFTVEGGDDVTATHVVDTVTPPSIESVKVFFEYPAYMRKPNTPPDRPEALGNVVAPFHTKVRFEAVTNEDLKAARFLLGFKGKEQASPLAVSPTAEGKPRLLKGEFTVTEASSEYALELQAGNGLNNRDDIRFSIKGLEDRLPEIVVIDPIGDEFVTELCDRPLSLEVKDDHGVARIALEVQIRSQLKDKTKEWYAVEFTREQNSRDYGEPLIRSESSIDISKMGLQAGDHVELRFRAEDYKDIGARNTRLSRVYKLSVVPLGVLEKELQDAIEKIKILLRDQKNRQEAHWNRSTRLVTNFGKIDLLSPEQQSEVRQAGLEQNDITSKLDGARKDIRFIQRRGVYNKIYNEGAAAKLQAAVDELSHLVGDPAEPTRPALSRVAAAGIDQSAKLKSGTDRARALRDAQNIQSQVTSGIQRALEQLERWSSYQEVIRIARDLKKMQDDQNKIIPQKK